MPEDSSNPFFQARQAGLSPIPVDTSTKRPLVAWKPYQDRAADLDELAIWNGSNIGIVCGSVSGRLIAIDIEGTFVADDGLPALAERLRVAGLYALWMAWVNGYLEETARGGLHVLVHVAGDGPLEGNRKLATSRDNEVLIETRGEGGYVVVAPSRNGTSSWKLLSGGFGEIAWATAEEWAAIVAVLASFDESLEPVAAPRPAPTPAILRLSESWIDDALAKLPPIEAVLEDHGWQRANHADAYGEQWTRPGKEVRAGWSASVSPSGRLYVHSSAADLPMGNPTLDALDVILAYELGRRPSSDERVAFLRERRPPAERGGAPGPAAEPEPSTHPRLDDAFWQSRPWLSALRTAAWARGLAPAGVLGAVLSTYATTVPMGIRLPAIWGAEAPLNTYCCVVGQSGTGKTTSMRLAADLVGPVHNPDVLLGRSLRSGEGLIRLATKATPKDGDPTFRNAVQITFDEGAALGKQAERAGATVIPYLNTAWAGFGVVGGAKAGESGYFPADLVRVCALIGVQYRAAANLFTGESAALGFPQRLLFFGLRDAEMMDQDVDSLETGRAQALGLADWEWSEFVRHPRELYVDPDVVREVRLWTRDKDHGAGLDDPLDGHRMQLQLRVAALLAVAEGELAIDAQGWDLARIICDVSRSIRSALLVEIGDVSAERARAQGLADVVREEVRDEAWLSKRARRISAHAKRHSEGVTMKELKVRLNALERPRRDEIVAFAEAKGWVIHKDGRYFGRGD